MMKETHQKSGFAFIGLVSNAKQNYFSNSLKNLIDLAGFYFHNA